MVVRKKALTRVGGFDRLPRGADRDMWYRLAANGCRMAVVQRTLASYRKWRTAAQESLLLFRSMESRVVPYRKLLVNPEVKEEASRNQARQRIAGLCKMAGDFHLMAGRSAEARKFYARARAAWFRPVHAAGWLAAWLGPLGRGLVRRTSRDGESYWSEIAQALEAERQDTLGIRGPDPVVSSQAAEEARFPSGRNFRARKTLLAAAQALTPRPTRILSLGVGAGETEKAIRDWCGAYVMGIEIDERLAGIARSKLDAVVCGDVETLEALRGCGEFDLIICGEILEHLREPQTLLRRLSPFLSAGGVVLITAPNVRHWHVLYPLLLKGEWKYRDSGILDATHLRFFTRKSLCRMIEEAGYRIREVRPKVHSSASTLLRSVLIKLLGFCLTSEFVAYEFLILATKASDAPSGSPADRAETATRSGQP